VDIFYLVSSARNFLKSEFGEKYGIYKNVKIRNKKISPHLANDQFRHQPNQAIVCM
jgi:hypothetical protein